MGVWHRVSGEVCGAGHKRRGVPCQDRTLCMSKDGTSLIALADGAGSAKLSHVGAETVIKAIGALVTSRFEELWEVPDNELMETLIRKIRSTLSFESIRHNCSQRDLASTLLVAAVHGKRWMALHVGDGVIGVYERDRLTTLSAPENGEYSSETWFTSSKDLAHHLRVYRGSTKAVSGFILMSDGVEPSVYDAGSNTLATAASNLLYLNARYGERESSAILMDALSGTFSQRTNDDCSISLMSRSRFRNYDEYDSCKRLYARRARKSHNDGE